MIEFEGNTKDNRFDNPKIAKKKKFKISKFDKIFGNFGLLNPFS